MSYEIEIRLANKKGWHTPAEARAYYKKYDRAGATWHWWGDPALNADNKHDSIVNYILGKATAGTGSVNYVLSNTKITMLVNPDNVAWASQSGNPTTISVELSPNLNAEGYKKAGWLFNELEGRYGKTLGHWKHSDWFATACPGSIDINRIKEEARKWKNGEYNPKPTPPVIIPVPPSSPKNTDFTLWKDGGTYVANKQPTQLYDMTNVSKWADNIPVAKSFNKGELIQIAGSFHNVGLNRDYYITRYSFDKTLPTGFNPVDLDVYAPPVVIPPQPPEVQPEPPVEPTDPTPTPEPESDISWIKRALQAILSFLKIPFK